MRYKINLNINAGEDNILSLNFHSECVELIERDDECEGVIVEVPEGCDGEFSFEIITVFGQTITDTLRVCGTCPECERCVNNICVKNCNEDEFCLNNDCVECLEDATCSGGKICIQGECRCPIGSVWNGEQCIFQNNCEPCQQHNPITNECTPIQCPQGRVCKPSTGECVECNNSGQCSNGKICINNECKCPTGYIESPVTGNCIPAPSCENDNDCGDCFECVSEQCVEKQCGANEICINDVCRTLCSEDGDCPENQFCDGGICSEIPIDCDFPQLMDIQIGYSCPSGLIVTNLPQGISPEFLQFEIDGFLYSVNAAVNTGVYQNVRVFYVNCEYTIQVLNVQQCLSCVTGECIAATPNIGLATLAECQSVKETIK